MYGRNPTWKPGAAGGTMITATALENIENGIVDADVTNPASAAHAALGLSLASYDDANSGPYASVGERIQAVQVDAPFATVPAYNATLATKRKWRKALGRVNSGTGNAKLCIVGDSTSWGIGSGGADGGAWPRILADMLNRTYAPTQYSFIVPPGSSAPKTAGERDDRWGDYVGAGWGDTQQGFGALGAISHGGSSTSSPLTVTPGIECDTFEIYYLQNSGLGTIAVSVDGGSTTTQSTAGSLGWGKLTITAPAGFAHVLSIVKSVNTVFILGVDAYLSTRSSIHVMNAGVSNSRAYQVNGAAWSNSSAGGSLAGIAKIAPDNTIVQLGINDARLAASSTADQWEGAIRAIVATAQLSGDVTIASTVPSATGILQNAGVGPGAVPALEKEYRDRCLAIAISTGSTFVDIFSRYGSFAEADAAGFMADQLHTFAAGSADMADGHRRVLTA